MLYEIGAYGMKRIDTSAPAPAVGSVLRFEGGYGCRNDNPTWVVVGVRPMDQYFHNNVLLLNYATGAKGSCGSYSIRKDAGPAVGYYLTNQILTPSELLSLSRRGVDTMIRNRHNKEQAEAAMSAELEKGRALAAKYIPEGTENFIVAEYLRDDSDPMTDYFGHTTTETVILGWSKHSRDIFSELRKFANKIPETAHFATAPEPATDEHREKYSMGHGYYLQARGNRSGWTMRKAHYMGKDEIARSLAKRCIFGD